MNIKSQLRIPTEEQFAFIEVAFEGTPQETVDAYRELTDMVQSKYGLEAKDWRAALDKYLTTNKLLASEYEGMSNHQKAVVQELKKAFKRINKE